MTTLPKLLAAFGLVVTALSATASADTYHHIDQLALQIDRDAKRLVSESRHYRHTDQYRHLVADAREMSRLADHIHDLAHHHGSLAHLESDVAELDAQFHHLESVFDSVELHAAHGHGHVHGNTAHVKRLLNSIEDNIHHLQEDLQSLRRPVHSTHRVVVPQSSYYSSPYSSRWGGYNVRPQSSGFGFGGGHQSYGHPVYGHQSYGYGTRGRGITIGGGSSQFTIRF